MRCKLLYAFGDEGFVLPRGAMAFGAGSIKSKRNKLKFNEGDRWRRPIKKMAKARREGDEERTQRRRNVLAKLHLDSPSKHRRDSY